MNSSSPPLISASQCLINHGAGSDNQRRLSLPSLNQQEGLSLASRCAIIYMISADYFRFSKNNK